MLFKLDRNDLRHACFLHGYAVESSGGLHRPLVMSDDDELRLFGHFGDLIDESADVGVIERSVHLIEQTERRWPVLEYRHYQCDRRHSLFTAGEQKYILQAFAGRLGDDLNAGLENIFGFEQRHLAAAAAK